jgi:hypothetical protein
MSGNVRKCPEKKDPNFAAAEQGAPKPVAGGVLGQDEAPEALPDPAETGHLDPGGDDKSLSNRQLRVLDLLLDGVRDTRAAAQVGVDARTVYRWRRQPEFARELERRRGAFLAAGRDRLRALLPGALDVIEKQVGDRYERTAFRAASLIARLAFREERRKQAANDEEQLTPGA